jgi:coenzyme F420-reducing hydrogenase beta subunit
MNVDSEGFKYPEVDYNKCIKCGLCIEVCPLIESQKIEEKKLKAYACFNKDEKIRLESSSGGIFTLLAEEIINSGGVVFGAGWNKNLELEHSFVEIIEELSKFRGSKYLQSKIGSTFNQTLEFLKKDRKVMFTGTPCQIGGLKSFLDKKLDEKKIKKLLCVDFICHGVPSPKVFKKYLEYQEINNNSKTERIAFRLKNEGWKLYSVSLLFNNNTEYRKQFRDDLYMNAFLTDIDLRPACHDCGYKSKNRVSDITMADFWGIQNVLPKLDDDKGTSLILVHSDLGNRYYSAVSTNIISEEVDVDEALKYNSAAIKSVKPHSKRKEYFDNLDSMDFDKLHNKYVTLPFIVKAKRKIKGKVGNILRKSKLKLFN